MKKLFKKTMTVLGSVALLGATAGFASAASYPAPFDGGATVITGSNAASSDGIAASRIVSGLQAHAAKKSTGKTKVNVEDGKAFLLEKSSTKFNIGDTITGVYSSALDDEELEDLLAEGTYEDTNNDEFDFTQEIDLTAQQLTMFTNSDYDDEEPTLGFEVSSGANVLNYTLDFSDSPDMADLPDTDMTFMGQEYYVLSVAAANDTITLLDSATEVSISEGDTKTITSGSNTYEISIDFIGSAKVSFNVNGEVTKTLAEGATYKLDSGEYIAVEEHRYNSKDTGISSAIVSIGDGKLVLTNNSDLEINDDTVNDLVVRVNSVAGKLNSVVLEWNAEDDLFITDESSITMPGFETVKLSMETIEYPSEETIEVGGGSDDYMSLKNFPLKDSEEDINFLFTNGSEFQYIGKGATNQLRSSAGSSITFDDDTDDYFVASYNDGNDAESYLMRATNFKIENSVNKTTFQYRKDGSWADAKSDAKNGDTFSLGNVDLTVGAIDKTGESVVVSNTTANTNFYELYSKEGMKLILPHQTTGYLGFINVTRNSSGTPATSFALQFFEEDKDGDIAQGDSFNATVGLNTQSPKEVSVTDVVGEDVTFVEQGDTDVFRSFMYSALASELLWDKGPDQKTLDVVYHGDEVKANVYVTAASVGTSTEGETGIKTAKDSETSMYAGKNIVVVGGSAINTVAAELLGGAHRGEKFTEMTGVSAGGFLIQSFDRGGKTALLVAGYAATDTDKAATYLLNNEADVDTTPGKKYTGTSATEATLVTNEA